MTRRRYLAVAGSAAIVAGAMLWPRAETIVVTPSRSLQAALDDAPTGAHVVLAAGTHEGPVTLHRPVILRGESGALVTADPEAPAVVMVSAPDVTISSLRVEGGDTGIVVREVERAVIDDVQVTGASLHGIEAIDASVSISDVVVDDLTSDVAQGIEIRNSDGRPDSIVTRTDVTGGQEGIVSHVSEVEVRDNRVAGTTLRGITITEMSDGIVANNIVVDAAGTGFYCGDMSRCAFSGNTARDIGASPGGRSAAGWGLVVTYHSAASSHGNDFSGASGELLTSMGSHMRDRSPLDPRSATVLLLPMSLAVLISLALATVGFYAARAFRRRGPLTGPRLGAIGGVATFLVALGVQSFHMVEHWLQVYRVHVDLIPSRGGLVGPSVEAEWVHLTYNGALLFLLVLVLLDLRRSTRDARVGMLGGAVLIQGWHLIEHSAKIYQHITTGAKVNPGVLGNFTDLVWFHFTINFTVYLLCVAVAIVWLRVLRQGWRAPARQPIPA